MSLSLLLPLIVILFLIYLWVFQHNQLSETFIPSKKHCGYPPFTSKFAHLKFITDKHSGGLWKRGGLWGPSLPRQTDNFYPKKLSSATFVKNKTQFSKPPVSIKCPWGICEPDTPQNHTLLGCTLVGYETPLPPSWIMNQQLF